MGADSFEQFESIPLLFQSAVGCRTLFEEYQRLTETVMPEMTGAIRSGAFRGAPNEGFVAYLKLMALYQQVTATLCAFDLFIKMAGQIVELLEQNASPEARQSLKTFLATQSLDPDMEAIVEDRTRFIANAKKRQQEFETLVQNLPSS